MRKMKSRRSDHRGHHAGIGIGRVLAAACAASAVPALVNANTTYYFVGTNGLWNTASNWSPAAVPTGSSADAYIGDSANTSSVVLNMAYTSSNALDNLTINSVAVGQVTLYQNTSSSAMVATNESIGTTISPNYYNQSAGTNTVTNLLAFGTQANGVGDYYLSGSGVLDAASEQIGNNATGYGAFYQSGGTNIVSNLTVGNLTQSPLTNSYTMTGGTLNVSGGSVSVGGVASSSFNQTGGMLIVAEFLNVYGDNSSYTLSGNGAINPVPTQDGIFLQVGSTQATNDSFIQTGGTFNTGLEGQLDVGSAGGAASYTLSANTGTGSLAADFELIGGLYTGAVSGSTSGTFNQSGGSNTITAALNIGGNYSSPPSPSHVATGLYNLTGGTLNTGTINACQISSGAINQSGGTAIFLQLAVGDTQYSNGVYTLAGGNLNVANGGGSLLPGYSLMVGAGVPTPNFGWFNQTGGSAVTAGLTVGDGGLGFFYLSGTGTFNCSGAAQIGLASRAALIPTFYNSNVPVEPAYGVYLQTGGTAIVSGGMTVGDFQSGNTSNGQVTLTGGTLNLSSSSLALGLGGMASMNQTGGTLTSGGLQMANGSTGTVLYLLSGPAATSVLTVNGSEVIGITEPAIFNQSGGTHSVFSGEIELGQYTAGSGTYQFNGGTLVASNIVKGAGSASFDFNGGALNAGGTTFGLFSNFSPTINTSGAVMNTSGFTVAIISGLLHNPGLGAALDGGLTVTGGGTLILTAPGTYTGRTTINSGLLVAYFNQSSPSIGSGPLTLNGGEAILHGISAGTVAYAILGGYNSGAWNGPTGINSASAANDTNHLTAVGMLVPSSATTFYNQSLGTGDVAIKYTYYGDANLDGKVDGSDYSRIDNGALQHLTGWYNGDFNYDGVINGSDYTLIDNAFNTQGAQLDASFSGSAAVATAQIAITTAVPEPATFGLLAMGTVLLIGRGGRRRN